MTPLRALACPFVSLRRSNAILLSLALVLAVSDGAAAQGLVFEPDEAYAQYPKVERHRAFLPERVDLSSRFPTPGDQGEQGSCVGWAVGYAARSYYAVIREGRPRNQIGEIPSPSYIYGAIKPAGDCDTGSLITRALDLLSRDGAVSMARFPYNHRQCPIPNRVASPQFRIANWRAINTGVIDDVKGALARGHPVIIGSQVTKDFINLRGDGVWRGAGERIPGGHAMTLVGYDERLQAFRVINSWGTRWGNGGFGWIGYEAYRMFTRQAYVMDVAAGPGPAPFSPAPPVPPKRISSFEPGLRLQGDFLPRSDASSEALTAQICQARCLDDARCAAWRWYHASDPVAPRNCALFSAIRQRLTYDSAISGVVSFTPAPPAPGPAPQPGPAPRPIVTLDPPLASYQCAGLDVVAAGSTPTVRGFVGTQADLDKLRESARRANVAVDVSVRPWPQCETLVTFKEVFAEPGAPQLRLRGDKRELRKGDPLVIEVTTPPTPSYLYLVYVQADGKVVYLVQPRNPAPSPQPQSRTIVLGDGSAGGPKFTIDPPYGNEMILAITSQSPLFEQGRPSPEIEREFLTAFRKALLVRPTADSGKRKVAGAWIALTTKE